MGDSRWYTWDGELVEDADLRRAKRDNLVPSVTTVLQILDQPGIRKWRDEMGAEEADRIGQEARDEGKRLHAIIEAAILCRFGPDTLEMRDDDVAMLGPLFDWLSKEIDWREPVVCEDMRVHPAGYGGTVDLQFTDNRGRRCIADYKTQNGRVRRTGSVEMRTYFNNWAIQFAGYTGLASPSGSVERWVTLVVNRDPDHPAVKVKEWTRDEALRAMEAWRGLLPAWKAINNHYPEPPEHWMAR